MTASKYKVELTDAERNQLTGVVRRGQVARSQDKARACAVENRSGSIR